MTENSTAETAATPTTGQREMRRVQKETGVTPEEQMLAQTQWPLSVMAGAEWNVLDARGARIACFKFADCTESESIGTDLARQMVETANRAHEILSPDDKSQPIHFTDLMLHCFLQGTMTAVKASEWFLPYSTLEGKRVDPTLHRLTVRAVAEHLRREGVEIDAEAKTMPCPECDGSGLVDVEQGDGNGFVTFSFYSEQCPRCKGRKTIPATADWIAEQKEMAEVTQL